MKLKKVGMLENVIYREDAVVYDANYLARTIKCNGGGNYLVKVYRNYISWKNKKGEYNTECNRASLENQISLTIPTSNQTKVALNTGGDMQDLKIRKLTPKECIRLMGFTDEDYQAMRDIGMSDSAIYHVAGDSIVVPVLIGIFEQMFDSENKHLEIIQNYVKEIKTNE